MRRGLAAILASLALGCGADLAPGPAQVVFLASDGTAHPAEDGDRAPAMPGPTGGLLLFVSGRTREVQAGEIDLGVHILSSEGVAVFESYTQLILTDDGTGLVGPLAGRANQFAVVPACLPYPDATPPGVTWTFDFVLADSFGSHVEAIADLGVEYPSTRFACR